MSAPTLPMLPMLPAARLVDTNWHCHRSGDCCTKPQEVVMTREERMQVILHAPGSITSEWRDLENGMVALKAQPCPFFIFKSCQVYEHRPYSCRRFACMRPDPKTEPFELGNGPTGCKNADDRFLTSRKARRMLVDIQRKAQKWARKYGWKED